MQVHFVQGKEKNSTTNVWPFLARWVCIQFPVLPLFQDFFSLHSPPFSYIRQSVSFPFCLSGFFLLPPFILQQPPPLLPPLLPSTFHSVPFGFLIPDSELGGGFWRQEGGRAWHLLSSFPAGKGKLLLADLGSGCGGGCCCRASREEPAALAEPKS